MLKGIHKAVGSATKRYEGKKTERQVQTQRCHRVIHPGRPETEDWETLVTLFVRRVGHRNNNNK